MLIDFYQTNTISSQSVDGKTKIEANLTINKAHAIFSGHFPGLPIVPGVCMIQIVKEILEIQLGRKFRLTEASNIKFLSVINPERDNEINAEILHSYIAGCMDVEAKLFFNQTIFFKIKAAFSDLVD